MAVFTQSYFLPSPISVGANATATNGANFSSREITIGESALEIASIAVMFTRTTGASNTVDFYFDVSFDDGTTWATLVDGNFSIATNYPAISGNNVCALKMYNLYGISKIRLAKIVNTWTGGDLTNVNVSLSTSK